MKIMDEIAEEAVAETGFFHSGRMIREDGTVPYRDRLRLQSGVARTNCVSFLSVVRSARLEFTADARSPFLLHQVDCLDRTNIAQVSISISLFICPDGGEAC